MIQKLLQHGNADIVAKLTAQLVPKALELSLHNYGCRYSKPCRSSRIAPLMLILSVSLTLQGIQDFKIYFSHADSL